MNIGIVMAVIIIAIVLALSLKSRNPEISSIISISICVIIIGMCVGRIKTIINAMDKLYGYIRLEQGYLSILLKLIGIAYVCEFASGISKDAGYSAVSSQIELVGKLTMLTVSLPVLMQVINTILDMM